MSMIFDCHLEQDLATTDRRQATRDVSDNLSPRRQKRSPGVSARENPWRQLVAQSLGVIDNEDNVK